MTPEPVDPPPIRTLASRIAYANPWLQVREDEIAYADGTTSIYGVVLKPDFALVLPRDPQGFWIVGQYRYAIGRPLWEFPQGAWPAGHTGSPEELARAELAEETGLTASSMRHLGRLIHAQGMSPTAFDVYLAEGLTPGTPRPEATEQGMEHRFVTDAELELLLRDGGMCDAASLAALTLYRLHLDG